MWVLYVFVLVVLIPSILFLIVEKGKIKRIKRNGVKTIGIILDNDDSSSDGFYRLGGNSNNPLIKFVTDDGLEITGRPIIGFISQHSVSLMDKVSIIYDRHNPQKFCVVEV